MSHRRKINAKKKMEKNSCDQIRIPHKRVLDIKKYVYLLFLT